jgi:hypothetical protein
MKAKTLRILRICALSYGWLLVLNFAVRDWGPIFSIFKYNRQIKSRRDPAELLYVAPFDIMKSFESFFSILANAFLAFLVAAVFRMIEKQAPAGNEKAKRLMIVCCLSYVASAMSGIFSVIWKARNEPQYWQWPNLKGSEWLFGISFTSGIISLLIPVLYAITIFALYTHFSRMVTFESEVA